jgi:type II secretion system protein G
MLKNKKIAGFTLVELLVVIAILGVLVTIGLTSFTSAQARGRDTKRKSDLKQIASALELYYNDYGSYPGGAAGGLIEGCPSTTTTPCPWGTSQFSDGKTTYFQVLPKDPSKGYNYYYRKDASNLGFQLYAHLENTQDPDIISTSYPCGVTANSCNFAITSPNTTPSQ